MKMFLLRIGVIVLLATGAGLVRARHLTWIPDVQKVIDDRNEEIERHNTLRERAGITLDRFKELINEGAVVIDARPHDSFEEGHLALETYPPVLNIPPDEIDANYERLSELIGLPLVLYCTSDKCDMAEEIFPILQGWGFTDIWIFFPGYAGILEAKLPTTTGPDTWQGFEAQHSEDESAAEEDYPSMEDQPDDELPNDLPPEDQPSDEPTSPDEP